MPRRLVVDGGICLWLLAPLFLLCPSALTADSPTRQDYPVHAVPFADVKVNGGFWQSRLDTNRTATIPHALAECDKTGRIDNFVKAAAKMKGKFLGYFFNDSDVYKMIEAASYTLITHPDPELEKSLDAIIAKIADAQEPDGYLYTPKKLAGPDYMPPGGKEHWSDIENGHELYCCGTLYEAGAEYFKATGKRNLLDIAVKNADMVCSLFNENGNHSPCGHPEIEIGLVKLGRATSNEKYLKQAQFFCAQRGHPTGRHLYGEYAQDHKPVLEQDEAVGHAVRALYLYSGMTDVAALFGDAAYTKVLEGLWTDIVTHKLYVTGGVGSVGGSEGFGPAYDLPNRTAYCETCANIANCLWNQRMFQLTGDARFIDVLERSLYNGVLSGESLDGKAFFYPNPLESAGRHARSPWFDCACCPPSVARFIPQVPGYAYATRGDQLFVNLFMDSSAKPQVAGQAVSIKQETHYPWDGQIKLTIDPEKAGQSFALLVRIPGWAREEPVPSDLYRYASTSKEKPAIRVNAQPVEMVLDKGYAVIRREWKPGDVVEVNLPMPVRRILAHEKLTEDAGKVALQRGPIVYCVESPDVKTGRVSNLMLPDDTDLSAEMMNVQVIHGRAFALRAKVGGDGIEKEMTDFTAIPYYAWANRGPGEMSVWLAHNEKAARPLPAPTIASTSQATSSGGDPTAANDQREPKASNDQSNPPLHWWPHKGTKEWVQYDFAKAARVSAVEVYWFDDTGAGECRLPKSWQLRYRKNGEWKPVVNPSGFGCVGDRYNRTTFDPVDTDGLRLEVQLPEGFAAGIHEWRVSAD